MRKIWCYCFS